MHELRFGKAGDVEAVEQGELLQRNRSGAPRAGLADGGLAVLERHDGLEGRSPRCHVVARQQAPLRFAEAVDLVGDKAFVEELASPFDLLVARAAGRLCHDPPIGRGKHGIAELRSDLGHRQVEISRGRPTGDQIRPAGDGQVHAADDREAVVRIVDRERKHVLERPGAEFPQQQQPAAEGAGNAGREHARAGNQVEAQLTEALDRRRRWSDSLTAKRERLAPIDRVEERRDFTAGAVQVRLHHLEREAGRNRGVERVPTALQNRHARCRGKPVRRRDHAERSAQLRSGREHDA